MRTLGSVIFCGLVASVLHATPVPACPDNQTLQDYETQFTAGDKCANGILNFSNFFFEVYTASGSGIVLTASQIDLTPVGTPGEAGVTGFSFTGLSDSQITATPGQDLTYVIDWLFLINDSGTAAGASLGIDAASGNLLITQYYCLDSNFSSGQAYTGSAPTCTTSLEGTVPAVQTLNVSPTLGLSDSVTFNPAAEDYANVMTVIQLVGGSSGVSFDTLRGSAQTVTPLPEPGTLPILTGALLVIGVLRKRAIT